jgi:hypothetical protein
MMLLPRHGADTKSTYERDGENDGWQFTRRVRCTQVTKGVGQASVPTDCQIRHHVACLFLHFSDIATALRDVSFQE